MKDHNEKTININDTVEFIIDGNVFDLKTGKVKRFTNVMVVIEYDGHEYRRDPYNVRIV